MLEPKKYIWHFNSRGIGWGGVRVAEEWEGLGLRRGRHPILFFVVLVYVFLVPSPLSGVFIGLV